MMQNSLQLPNLFFFELKILIFVRHLNIHRTNCMIAFHEKTKYGGEKGKTYRILEHVSIKNSIFLLEEV